MLFSYYSYIHLCTLSRICNKKSASFSVLIPNRPDKAPTDPNSFIKLECETDEKYYSKGLYASKVPSEVYSLFSFMRKELENGWFGIKMETDETDIKKQYTKVWKFFICLLRLL